MIREIHMKECATYDASGASLLDCKKINYIYGANGSGKSTISYFLNNQEDEKYLHSSIVWDSMGPVEIKVYNREFRESNFQKSDIEGVFTLGKATIEDIKELENTKTELALKNGELIKHKESLFKQEEKKRMRTEQFKKDIWESIFKQHEEEFGEAFDGYKKSKDKFYQEVVKRFQNISSIIKPLSTLQERAKTLYASKPEMYNLLSLDISDERKRMDEIINSPIWQKVIVGNESIPIAKLIKQLENSDWVRTGQKYILGASICPFCQKETIDEEFKRQLEQFFAGEYEQNVQEVLGLYSQYQVVTNVIKARVETVLSYSVSMVAGKVDKEVLDTKRFLLESQFISNDVMMQNKIKEPSSKVNLIDVNEIIDELQKILDEANEKISSHNELVKNIKDEKTKLANDIWNYCLNEQKSLIDGYNKDIDALDKSIIGISKLCTSLQENVNTLELSVVEKGKNITSVQPTVDEMNRLLTTYGFTNFSIVPSKEKKNCYQIQRKDGKLAFNTLSEGEETFISFLYFMQFTKGATDASKVSSKRIIVLDDPICSLDSTILYVVSSMVKQLATNIKKGLGDVEQLFVFTHNVFFHKEASFIDGRTKEINDANYWIIRKDGEVSRIKGYGRTNPISTSYELLWKELSEGGEMSIITLQNTMRRIIENYFGLLGGKKEDYIKGKFETLEEQTICESLFYWINDGSHTIPDDLFIDSYSDVTERYKDVFFKIFKATGHEAHYNMMMGIEES